MPRWSKFETDSVQEVRKRLAGILTERPQFPEVVGERKILRFLRGHDYQVDIVCEKITNFLSWRDENGVDAIRQDIVMGGMDHPTLFPKGSAILAHMPQLVIAPDLVDKNGCPLGVESYSFRPAEVLEHFQVADYVHYFIYCLEYKSLILEQLSLDAENSYLATLSDEEREKALSETDFSSTPYGVIKQTTIIRDLGGLGFDHVGPQGQEIVQSMVAVSTDNYPEMLSKCFLINCPWLFNALWFFVRGLLTTKTLSKIELLGSDYKETIQGSISTDNLPAMLGGPNGGSVAYFKFHLDVQYFCPDSCGGALPPSPPLTTITAIIERVAEAGVASESDA